MKTKELEMVIKVLTESQEALRNAEKELITAKRDTAFIKLLRDEEIRKLQDLVNEEGPTYIVTEKLVKIFGGSIKMPPKEEFTVDE